MHYLPDSNTVPTSRNYLTDDPLTIESVIGYLPGQTQSKLVRCSDGKKYVVKVQSALTGRCSSANEVLGSILLHELGFATPIFRYAKIDLTAIRNHPDLIVTGESGYRLPEVGLHFASEFMEDSAYGLLYDLAGQPDLPPNQRSLILGIYLFDLWACHLDPRQFLCPNHHKTGEPLLFFIDNGHLFGGGHSWDRWTSPNTHAIRKALSRRFITHDEICEWVNFFGQRIPSILPCAISQIHSTQRGLPLTRLEDVLLDRVLRFHELLNEC